MNTKETIIWLEDNAYEPGLIDLADYIESLYNLRIAGGISSLKLELEEAKENNEKIKGVMLDLMVHGATDLSAFGMPDVSWDKGYSHVGEMILKYIFRNHASEHLEHLSDTSIIFLTVKSDFKNSNVHKYGGSISVVQKYDETNDKWCDEVKKWIGQL